MNQRNEWISAVIAAFACVASAGASAFAFMEGRPIMNITGALYGVAAAFWLYTTIMHIKAARIYRRIKPCRE